MEGHSAGAGCGVTELFKPVETARGEESALFPAGKRGRGAVRAREA